MHVSSLITSLALILSLATLQACKPSGSENGKERSRIHFDVTGTVTHWELNEISGLETISNNELVVINDEGAPLLWKVTQDGRLVDSITIEGAKNRDWEDLAIIDTGDHQLLAIADLGDNLARRESVLIYFVPLAELTNSSLIEAKHTLELTYPDGPRDCESLAFDSVGNQLLLLTKRDKPPRLYGISLDEALDSTQAELEFLATVPTLRPPTRGDMQRLGKDGAWVSQPTGMDINSASDMAAVITYRSLYLFSREHGQTWAQAFQQRPREFLGPGSPQEEAIAFDMDDQSLIITSEGNPVPVYKAALPEPPDSGR